MALGPGTASMAGKMSCTWNTYQPTWTIARLISKMQMQPSRPRWTSVRIVKPLLHYVLARF